jgi:hypothetical protein
VILNQNQREVEEVTGLLLFEVYIRPVFLEQNRINNVRLLQKSEKTRKAVLISALSKRAE